MVKLSICIATYNRVGFIGQTLESIIPQLTPEVELLVVDGASTDGTEGLVREYLSRCDGIRYVRLPVKGGIDRDYDKAVELAQGEMCWLFTDDDLLKPRAVSSVLLEAKKRYSLIVVNSEVRDKYLSKIKVSRKLQVNGNTVFSKIDTLFKSVIPYLSFIGGVVVNRDLWLHRERERYFGTEFIHVGVVFQSPLPFSALVIAEPLIIIRWGNAQWTARGLDIWMFKWPDLLNSFENVPERLRITYRAKESWPRLKGFLIYRAKGLYSLKVFKDRLLVEDTSLRWKLFLFFVSVVPYKLARFLIKSYLRFANRGALDEWR